MNLTFDLPATAFSSLRQPPSEFIEELRLAAAVKWYELGKISQAKGAEIAGLSRAEFIEALHRYKVPAVQCGAGDLEQEANL